MPVCPSSAGCGRPPRLGPWISTTRLRSARFSSSTAGTSSSGSVLRAMGLGAPAPPAGPSSCSSPSLSPLQSDVWQKPPKVARRWSGREAVSSGSLPDGSAFAPLSGLGDRMEFLSPPDVPADIDLPDSSFPVLKRPRSPSEEAEVLAGKGVVASEGPVCPLVVRSQPSGKVPPCLSLPPAFEGPQGGVLSAGLLGGHGARGSLVLGVAQGGPPPALAALSVVSGVSSVVGVGGLLIQDGASGEGVGARPVVTGKGKAVLVEVQVLDGASGGLDSAVLFSSGGSAAACSSVGQSARRSRGRRASRGAGRGRILGGGESPVLPSLSPAAGSSSDRSRSRSRSPVVAVRGSAAQGHELVALAVREAVESVVAVESGEGSFGVREAGGGSRERPVVHSSSSV